MPDINPKPEKRAVESDIELFVRAMKDRTVTIEANEERFADAYYAVVTEINPDGSFKGWLTGAAPCM